MKVIYCVKMYSGFGCAIGGGFNPALPPNNSLVCPESHRLLAGESSVVVRVRPFDKLRTGRHVAGNQCCRVTDGAEAL